MVEEFVNRISLNMFKKIYFNLMNSFIAPSPSNTGTSGSFKAPSIAAYTTSSIMFDLTNNFPILQQMAQSLTSIQISNQCFSYNKNYYKNCFSSTEPCQEKPIPNHFYHPEPSTTV